MWQKLKGPLLFLLIFTGLSLPGVLFHQPKKKTKMAVTYPSDSRNLASIPQKRLKNCHPTKSWRHKCQINSKGEKICTPDVQQHLVECTK